MKVALYARVSRNSQELEQQIQACQRFCEYRGFEIAGVYSEKASGAKARRPEYDRLVTDLRSYQYDGVVVFRLDRLGRNARQLALIVDELEGKGIKVLSVNESFDTSTALGRAMRELIFVFAQLEREQISEATTQRLAAIREAGGQLGRKRASAAQIRRVRGMTAKGMSTRAIARNSELSKSTVSNIIGQRGAYAAPAGVRKRR